MATRTTKRVDKANRLAHAGAPGAGKVTEGNRAPAGGPLD
jgi:hypothetical protein